MKKTILLILCFSLLLTACSGPKAPESTEAAGTTASTALPSAAPTAPSDEPTAAPSAEPTATEPPATEPPVTEPEGYRAAGSRTSGGVYVHTDPSAYAPYGGSGAKYTRLRKGALDHFEPSEDYGAIYPYKAAVWYDFDRWGTDPWGTTRGYTYGFVDGTGRILTDGVYRSVYCLDGPPGSAGLNGYWVAERMVMEPASWSDDPEEDTELWPSFKSSLISMDGSRVMDCPYNSIDEIGNQILCRNSYDDFSVEEFDFRILDYDLETVFTAQDVLGYFGVSSSADIFEDAEYKGWYMEYRDGVLLITLSAEAEREDEEGRYSFFLYSSVFCDETGALVAGPFAGAEAFNEGLACVSTDGEHYGFIDKSGAWVIDPVFRSSGSFWNGQALLYTEDGRYVVIDHSGSECFSLGEEWCYREAGLYVQYQRSDDDWTNYYTYYDADGNFLIAGNELRCLNATTFYSFDKGDGVLRFLSPERRLLTVESGSGYPSESEALIDGELTKGWDVGRSKDRKSWLFVPEDCSRVIEVPYYENTALTDYGNGYMGRSMDPVTGETWHFFRNDTGWDGVTETGERLTVPLRSDCPMPMGGLIVAYTESASYLMTPGGKIIFCYPIDAQD